MEWKTRLSISALNDSVVKDDVTWPLMAGLQSIVRETRLRILALTHSATKDDVT